MKEEIAWSKEEEVAVKEEQLEIDSDVTEKMSEDDGHK